MKVIKIKMRQKKKEILSEIYKIELGKKLEVMKDYFQNKFEEIYNVKFFKFINYERMNEL